MHAKSRTFLFSTTVRSPNHLFQPLRFDPSFPFSIWSVSAITLMSFSLGIEVVIISLFLPKIGFQLGFVQTRQIWPLEMSDLSQKGNLFWGLCNDSDLFLFDFIQFRGFLFKRFDFGIGIVECWAFVWVNWYFYFDESADFLKLGFFIHWRWFFSSSFSFSSFWVILKNLCSFDELWLALEWNLCRLLLKVSVLKKFLVLQCFNVTVLLYGLRVL